MRIVHLGTHITAVFGVIDDEGNVVNKYPAELDLTVLTSDTFVKACDAIRKYRQQLIEEQANKPRGDTDVPSNSSTTESS